MPDQARRSRATYPLHRGEDGHAGEGHPASRQQVGDAPAEQQAGRRREQQVGGDEPLQVGAAEVQRVGDGRGSAPQGTAPSGPIARGELPAVPGHRRRHSWSRWRCAGGSRTRYAWSWWRAACHRDVERGRPEYVRKGPSGVVSGPVDALARSHLRSAVGGLVAPSYSILGLLAAQVRSKHVRRVAVAIVTAVVVAPSRSRISVARLLLARPTAPTYRTVGQRPRAAAHVQGYRPGGPFRTYSGRPPRASLVCEAVHGSAENGLRACVRDPRRLWVSGVRGRAGG